ncbi:transposase [Streptomyces sp. NBC_01218]|uniref:transposase n=1 Tax=Streptomyces sp. NBC_01218 TaxID=2903780 RepID=UPI002E0F9D4D
MARGDLTEKQWAVQKPLLPVGKKAGRPAIWIRRQLIDGLRFRVRTGVPWRTDGGNRNCPRNSSRRRRSGTASGSTLCCEPGPARR